MLLTIKAALLVRLHMLIALWKEQAKKDVRGVEETKQITSKEHHVRDGACTAFSTAREVLANQSLHLPLKSLPCQRLSAIFVDVKFLLRQSGDSQEGQKTYPEGGAVVHDLRLCRRDHRCRGLFLPRPALR